MATIPGAEPDHVGNTIDGPKQRNQMPGEKNNNAERSSGGAAALNCGAWSHRPTRRKWSSSEMKQEPEAVPSRPGRATRAVSVSDRFPESVAEAVRSDDDSPHRAAGSRKQISRPLGFCRRKDDGGQHGSTPGKRDSPTACEAAELNPAEAVRASRTRGRRRSLPKEEIQGLIATLESR